MERNRGLLPWIFGGLFITTVAVAIAVGSITTSNSVAPTAHAAPSSSAPQALPVAPALATPAPPVVVAVAPAPESAPAQAEVAAAQEVSSGQIWTCTTHGVKTFSNNPCGEKSSLLDVGPINTMNATRVLPSRAYPPDMHFAPAYPAEDTPEQPEEANSSYGVALVPYYVRKRPIHVYPSQHNRGPQPRNY